MSFFSTIYQNVVAWFSSTEEDDGSVTASGYMEYPLELFNTMFPGLFTLYVSARDIEGQKLRETYWKCDTCGERATQDVSEASGETVLSCGCRSNYTFGMEMWDQIATEANKIPLDSF